MIVSQNKLYLNEEMDDANRLFNLFRERIENASEIIVDDQDPEQEKARLLKLVSFHKKKLSQIRDLVQNKTDAESPNIKHSSRDNCL